MKFLEKWLGIILSALSLLVSIITIIFSNVTTITWIFTIVVFLFILFEIIFHIIRSRKSARLIFNKIVLDNLFEASDILYGLRKKIDKDFKFYKRKEVIKKDLNEVLNKICEIIYQYTRQKFSASIKIIENDPLGTSIMDKAIVTICRSKNSHYNRYNLDQQPTTAKQNTCYKEILEDNQQNHFICEDLSVLCNGQPNNYLNHNPHFLDYYKSIMVLPISTEMAYNEQIINNHNIIYGFLCIDSKSTLDSEKIDILYEISLKYSSLLVEYIRTYNEITGGYISELFK